LRIKKPDPTDVVRRKIFTFDYCLVSLDTSLTIGIANMNLSKSTKINLVNIPNYYIFINYSFFTKLLEMRFNYV